MKRQRKYADVHSQGLGTTYELLNLSSNNIRSLMRDVDFNFELATKVIDVFRVTDVMQNIDIGQLGIAFFSTRCEGQPPNVLPEITGQNNRHERRLSCLGCGSIVLSGRSTSFIGGLLIGENPGDFSGGVAGGNRV